MLRRRSISSLACVAALSAVYLTAACGQSTTPLGDRAQVVRSSDSDVAFTDCKAACAGTLDGAAYEIKLPSKWNGTLLLYSHGYRFAQPGPPSFDPVSTVAQVTSTDDKGDGSDALSQQLLSAGYALAGSSYKSNGWAVADGVKAA
jgi:hypothetical protein